MNKGLPKKKLYLFILGVVIIYFFLFIVIGLTTVFLPATVYDNPKLLAKDLNSATKKNYKRSSHDGITTITCGKMQGMDIIWKDDADEDCTRQMDYSLHVSSGKAKLILIQPDRTVITLVEEDSAGNGHSQESGSDTADYSDEMPSFKESSATLDLKKGKNQIKVVCEKGTSFALSFKIPE